MSCSSYGYEPMDHMYNERPDRQVFIHLQLLLYIFLILKVWLLCYTVDFGGLFINHTSKTFTAVELPPLAAAKVTNTLSDIDIILSLVNNICPFCCEWIVYILPF
jgi:hypothetical protein